MRGSQLVPLRHQARTVFENTRVVNDFDVFEIPYGEQTNSKPIKIDHVIEDREG